MARWLDHWSLIADTVLVSCARINSCQIYCKECSVMSQFGSDFIANGS